MPGILLGEIMDPLQLICGFVGACVTALAYFALSSGRPSKAALRKRFPDWTEAQLDEHSS
jgi:hypothetical protein